MVLRIVLEGIDNASDDFKRVKKNADETGDTFTDLEKKGAALVLVVNGMASGLNQMSGGLRKTADAMERTGRGTEAQRDALRGMSDTMELAAGPMEVLSGFTTLLATTVWLASKTGLTFSGVMSGVSTAALAVAGAITATTVAIAAIAAAIGLAIYLLYDYTEGFREWDRVLDNIRWKVDYIKDGIKGITDSANDMKRAVSDFTLSGIKDAIHDEIVGLGGIAQ